MNAPMVDFLPAEYRRRRAELRTRRERLLLLVPIALAVLATDHVLRQRVRIVQQMAQQANDHAEQGECRRDQVRQLAQRVAAAQAELGDWLEPLRAPRMTQVLDALLADRPEGVTLHELTCRHAPWSADRTPVMRLHASAASAGAFTAFLEHLQQEPALPPLSCQRTFHGDREGTIAFHLESTTPAGAAR